MGREGHIDWPGGHNHRSHEGYVEMKSNEWRKRKEGFKAYIKKSYEDGHGIEAIILLYQSVYALMYVIFIDIATRMRLIVKEPDKEPKEVNNIRHGISDCNFRTLAHMLYQMGAFDQELRSDLRKLASFRDRIMHRFLSGSLGRSQFGKAYQLGIGILDRVSEISLRYPEALDKAIRPITRPSLLAELLGKGGQSEQSRPNRRTKC